MTVVALFAVGILLGAGVFYVGYRLWGQTGGPSTLPVSETVIEIRDLTFNPNETTVDVGTKVTWVHRAPGFVHTVTSDEADGPLQSGNLSSGQSFSYLFVREGTYRYHCIPHSSAGMVGTIVVRTGGVR